MRPKSRKVRGPVWARAAQVIGLLALCGIGAELLAAYSESTGDPGAVTFALLFFAGLYGAPALLAREVVRRLGWGWPSLLLLLLALGIAQACLIDQSMFSADYGDYAGWETTRAATFIPALGISAGNVVNFVPGHLIYSFAAPVALAEGWAPGRAREPWLGPIGAVLASLAYLATAVMVIRDPESQSASPMQWVVSAGLMAAVVLAAVILGRAQTGRREAGRQAPLWSVAGLVLVVALISNSAGESWVGVIVNVVCLVVLGGVIAVPVATRVWSVRHSAAVAGAALLARGLLAFTYFPLDGDVAPVPKYAHNAVMVFVVLAVTALALRPRPEVRGRVSADTEQML